MKRILLAALLGMLAVGFSAPAMADECIKCHQQKTPGVVADYNLSKHKTEGVGCDDCHGNGHKTDADFANVKLPTPATCKECHEKQVTQFQKGKHNLAWAALFAMPTTHQLPMAMREGMKGCGGCHKIGAKSDADIAKLKKQGHVFGNASCDSCHTRHVFSKKEAQQPQACQTCHMGFDHPQWEMYSSSKHGVRYLLKQNGILPESASAPTCQTCHMQNGDHEVNTSWGFLAVTLPMPEDKQWAADRAVILQGLGVLDPKGKPTGRLDVVKAADVAKLTKADWQKHRDKMINACSQCHSENFAKGELQKGDDMIKSVDRLMAEAITTVAGLYKDGLLKKPKGYSYAFPDLLTFHDSPTPIENTLFVMFLKHRMRAFQGTFHANPDYALWYGWSEMKRDLTEIKHEADLMRAKKGKKKSKKHRGKKKGK